MYIDRVCRIYAIFHDAGEDYSYLPYNSVYLSCHVCALDPGTPWKFSAISSPTSSTGSTCWCAGCTSSPASPGSAPRSISSGSTTRIRPPAPGSELAKKGVSGELWAVHGGGFYNPQKYLVAPAAAAQGAALVQVGSLFDLAVRLRAAHHRLLLQRPGHDGRPRRGGPLAACRRSASASASLVVGWIVYDLLCRSPLGKHDLAFGARGVRLAGRRSAGVLTHFLSGRAAYIHVGAMIGTIMVANVADADHSRPAQDGGRDGRRAASPTRSTACAPSSAASTTTTSRCRCCSS